MLDRVSSNQPSRPGLHVVTYNTGSDDAQQAPQDRFITIGPLQRVLRGDADAPLVALQEAGDGLCKKLKEAAAKGKFHVLYQRSNLKSGLILVVPARFEVVSYEKKRPVWGNLVGCWRTFQAFHREHKPLKAYFHFAGSFFNPPAVQKAVLRDRETGQTLTVFNTHTSSRATQLVDQGEEILRWAGKADTERTLVLGDFNTPTADTDNGRFPGMAKVRQAMADAGLADMGPGGAEGVSLTGSNHQNIDYVLAKGFTARTRHMYKGAEMGLGPGFETAEKLSEHYAEEDELQAD